MIPDPTSSKTSNPPFKPIQSSLMVKIAIGLAYNLADKKVYYSDIQKGTINSVNFDGSNHEELFTNVGSIEGLAFDAIQAVLYWTSSSKHSISKARLKVDANTVPKVETVLILRPSDKPRGIDIDPCEGRIYFTNWNAKFPSIQRVSYSGYGLDPIVTTDIR